LAGRILVIDDDPAFREMLCEAVASKDHPVESAASAEEGLARVRKEPFDLVITDVMLPGMSGIEALSALKEAAPDVDVIVMTAFSSRDRALDAVRRGAYDYFSKPFSLSEMEIVIRRALEKRRLQTEIRSLRRSLTARTSLVGQGESMRRVLALIRRVAELDTTVLVTGESGTGKELVADSIHSLSRRAAGPFIKVNCAAIPENLLESELFGFEKGAFTGAVAARKGKFELAHGGTILLDEIGDMPLSIQPKLLRVVEGREVERLGGSRPLKVDVRIVAATNQDLAQLIAEKRFREDLYYRLNVAAIELPPLRERKEDLPLLAEHFLERINLKIGTDLRGLSAGAMDLLFAHDWPGNVRQLANILERAAIASTGSVLTGADIRAAFQRRGQEPAAGPGPAAAGGDEAMSLRRTLEEVERNLILSALQRAGGVQKDAAALLGISPKNLWNKLQKHAIAASRQDR
jgi:two-component system response regulator AtoC